MRTLGAFLLAIHGLALAAVYSQYTTWSTLVLCAALFALAGGLISLRGHLALRVLGLLNMAAAFVAGYGLATRSLWLGHGAGLAAGFAALLLVALLQARLRRGMQRIYFNELMVISNRLNGGLSIVKGPAWVLPVPGATSPLAHMPCYHQEHELRIEQINTRPQPGPLGEVSQNIATMVVELVYQLNPDAAMRAFRIHNQDTIFAAAGQAVGKGRREAMLDKTFWVEVWRLAMADLAERFIRTIVHRSNLTALEVSYRRCEIEAAVTARLKVEAAQIGLDLLECNILQVEPDEAGAALASRETLVRAQGLAEEIALKGEADAMARASMVRQMVEALRDSGGQVSTRMIELIIQGALPHPMLSSYLRSGMLELPGDARERGGHGGGSPN